MKKALLCAAALMVGTAAHADDWAGAYAGLAVTSVTGESTASTSSASNTVKYTSTVALSAFGGYNFQNGPLVYGGELFYKAGDTSYQGASASKQKPVTELRGRAGYAMGSNLMAYGFLAYSIAGYTENNISETQTGLGYGLGAEMAISDRYFAGLELSTRKIEKDFTLGSTALNLESKMNMISLRGGIKF